MRGRHALIAVGALVSALAAQSLIAPAEPAAPATGTVAGSAVANRPNFVFLMVDDMRRDELRFLPRTKKLIARRGVSFRNAIMPNPLCCPSRASVLTGLHSHNHGVWSHRAPWGFHAFDDTSTLAVWLHDAGYTTTYLGKYLNGYGEQPPPGQSQGRSTQYVPPGWSSWRGSIDGGLAASDPMSGSTYDYLDTTLNLDGHAYANYQGRYQTNVYAGLAADQIRELAAADEPFFSYVSFTAPHFGDPVEQDDPGRVRNSWGNPDRWVRLTTPARPRWVRGRFDKVITRAPGKRWQSAGPTGLVGRPTALPRISRTEWRRVRELARQRAEALEVVDRGIDRILTALAQTGEMGNTVVVFTSDNGYFLGEYKIRQGKTYPYSPAGRVPLLVRGPGIPAGQVRSDPFLSIDHAPTWVQAAGTSMPYEADGQSRWDVLRHGDQGWDTAVLTESAPGQDNEESSVLGVRTPDLLYAAWRGGAEELFDLRHDAAERHNLAKDPARAQDLTRMRQLLEQLRECRGADCRPPIPGP